MKITLRVLLVAAFVFAIAWVGVAEETKRDSLWEAGALNRDAAARALSTEGLMLLSEADRLRATSDADTDSRRFRFLKVGRIEMTAGGLFCRSRDNFVNGAEGWSKAAAEYEKRGFEIFSRAVVEKKSESLTSAEHASHLAAQSFERAAEAYGPGNAGNYTNSAVASEKAADCREWIAKRQ